MAGLGFKFVTYRRAKYPIAILHTRPHPVFGLLAFLFTLNLGNTGKQIFDQNTVGILTKFYGWRYQPATGLGQ